MKPRIGVTAFLDRSMAKGRYQSINEHYTRSVSAAGGLPYILPVLPDPAEADAWLDGLDGLLLSGGGDVSPLYYGEEPRQGLKVCSSERDEAEIALARAAARRGLPLLGICRGLQVINVALGGSLIQDIPREVPGALDHSPPEGQAMEELRHGIEVLPDTRMASLFGIGRLEVNSFHHQAVSKPASGLRISARAADGIWEALEGSGSGFLLAVQFHPEALTLRFPRFQAIFRALVEAAGG